MMDPDVSGPRRLPTPGRRIRLAIAQQGPKPAAMDTTNLDRTLRLGDGLRLRRLDCWIAETWPTKHHGHTRVMEEKE